MISFPIIIIFAIYVTLAILGVYAVHVAQLCTDKAEGLVFTERSQRSLTMQRSRAERTAAICLAVGVLLSVIIVSTLEFTLG